MSERIGIKGGGIERRRIERSGRDAMLGGVCAGIARHFGWPITGTRVAYVILSLCSAAFPGILVYLILWLLLPQAPAEARD
jgi:phage shock protein PspC (stress-responsive transcriptional regulator)